MKLTKEEASAQAKAITAVVESGLDTSKVAVKNGRLDMAQITLAGAQLSLYALELLLKIRELEEE
jgi:hypothetical protein